VHKTIYLHLIEKNVFYTKDLRLKASLRHGGTAGYFLFFVTNLPLGRPVGGGGITVSEGVCGNPVLYF
jgi:hypothetical protein